MIYITNPISCKQNQISFDDFFNGRSAMQKEDTMDTITYCLDSVPEQYASKFYVPTVIAKIQDFNERWKDLIAMEDKNPLYKPGKVPKKNGGWRDIKEPIPPLTFALSELKYLLESTFNANRIYHTTAFAYIKNRSAIQAARRHSSYPKWLLKIDMHNFFGSITYDFALKQLAMVFPFNMVLEDEVGKKEFKKMISLCFLDGILPQGTTLSPMLTNIIMVPIDYQISKFIRASHPIMVNTRYSDDINISSNCNFENFSVTKIMNYASCLEELERKLPVTLYQFKNGDANIKLLAADTVSANYTLGRLKKVNKEYADLSYVPIIIGTKKEAVKLTALLNNWINDEIPRTKVISKIVDIFKSFEAPLTLNVSKIHYGSNTGQSYILGVKVVGKNNLALGGKKQRALESGLYNLFVHPNKYSIEAAEKFYGQYNYCLNVEGNNANREKRFEKTLREYYDKYCPARFKEKRGSNMTVKELQSVLREIMKTLTI